MAICCFSTAPAAHAISSKLLIVFLMLILYTTKIYETSISWNTIKWTNYVTDFFDRIKLATDIKILVLEKHPGILSFLNSMYFENDESVKTDIKAILAKGEGVRSKIAFDGMDTSKFKDEIDPKLVMKMLTWFAEGYVSESSSKAGLDMEVLCKEFYDCINLLKNNFYKEEYI